MFSLLSRLLRGTRKPRHSRAGGNPELANYIAMDALDSRLRGNDERGICSQAHRENPASLFGYFELRRGRKPKSEASFATPDRNCTTPDRNCTHSRPDLHPLQTGIALTPDRNCAHSLGAGVRACGVCLTRGRRGSRFAFGYGGASCRPSRGRYPPLFLMLMTDLATLCFVSGSFPGFWDGGARTRRIVMERVGEGGMP